MKKHSEFDSFKEKLCKWILENSKTGDDIKRFIDPYLILACTGVSGDVLELAKELKRVIATKSDEDYDAIKKLLIDDFGKTYSRQLSSSSVCLASVNKFAAKFESYWDGLTQEKKYVLEYKLSQKNGFWRDLNSIIHLLKENNELSSEEYNTWIIIPQSSEGFQYGRVTFSSLEVLYTEHFESELASLISINEIQLLWHKIQEDDVSERSISKQIDFIKRFNPRKPTSAPKRAYSFQEKINRALVTKALLKAMGHSPKDKESLHDSDIVLFMSLLNGLDVLDEKILNSKGEIRKTALPDYDRFKDVKSEGVLLPMRFYKEMKTVLCKFNSKSAPEFKQNFLDELLQVTDKQHIVS